PPCGSADAPPCTATPRSSSAARRSAASESPTCPTSTSRCGCPSPRPGASGPCTTSSHWPRLLHLPPLARPSSRCRRPRTSTSYATSGPTPHPTYKPPSKHEWPSYSPPSSTHPHTQPAPASTGAFSCPGDTMTSPFEAFPRQPEWTRDALCAQTGPDDFTWFPHPGGSTREAKSLCAGCPVIAACLAHTLAT